MKTTYTKTAMLHIINGKQPLSAPVDAKFISIGMNGSVVRLVYETSLKDDHRAYVEYTFDCIPDNAFVSGAGQYIGAVKEGGKVWRYYVHRDIAFIEAVSNKFPALLKELEAKNKTIQRRAAVAVIALVIIEIILIASLLIWFRIKH